MGKKKVQVMWRGGITVFLVVLLSDVCFEDTFFGLTGAPKRPPTLPPEAVLGRETPHAVRTHRASLR